MTENHPENDDEEAAMNTTTTAAPSSDELAQDSDPALDKAKKRRKSSKVKKKKKKRSSSTTTSPSSKKYNALSSSSSERIGDDKASLKVEKTKYRRPHGDQRASSMGAENSSAELEQAKAQYRQTSRGGNSTSTKPPPRASAENGDRVGSTAPSQQQQRQQQQQEQQPPPTQESEYQNMRNITEEDRDRIGAYRILPIITTATTAEDENDIPTADVIPTANLIPTAQEILTDNDNVITSANVMPDSDAEEDASDSGSVYRDEADEERHRRGRRTRGNKNRNKTTTRSNGRRCTSRMLLVTIIALIVVLLVIVLVTVLLVAGGGESGDSGGDKNISGSNSTTENSCASANACDPGSLACQEDVICRATAAHIELWVATGCLGAIDCEKEFSPEQLGSNETLQEACNTLQIGTQECHNNIICKRRKNHAQYVQNSNHDFEVDSCAVPTPVPTSAPTTPSPVLPGGVPAPTPMPTPVPTAVPAIVAEETTEAPEGDWTLYNYNGFEDGWGLWSVDKGNSEWEANCDWASTENGCARLEEGSVRTLEGIPLINEHEIKVSYHFKSEGFSNGDRFNLAWSPTPPGNAQWEPADELTYGTDWVTQSRDQGLMANDVVITAKSASTMYLRFVVKDRPGKIYLDDVYIYRR